LCRVPTSAACGIAAQGKEREKKENVTHDRLRLLIERGFCASGYFTGRKGVSFHLRYN
jgi:hypothetical protein